MVTPMIIREIDVKEVVTKSNLPVCDYSLNPYVGCEHACKYCYACFMKRFTGHEEQWGEFVDVKFWKPIARPEKYAGKEIFIGSVTDPYQPCEEKFGRTRAVLEQLKGSGVRLSIATKSDLVLRDLDLIRTFPDARVSWSVNTLDERFRADMDKAAPVEKRLAALKAFHDAGVRTTCFISPIPRNHRRESNYRTCKGLLQLNLVGKPQPARHLQAANHEVYFSKISQAFAAVPRYLQLQSARLLGMA